jgi:hypothetical protein
VQTFTKDKLSYTYNTTMSEDSVALYSLDKVFPNWSPAALAAQATMSQVKLSDATLSWDAVDNAPGYAVFADGKFAGIVTGTSFAADANVKVYTVKAANAMGGFGAAVTAEAATATAISNVENNAAVQTEYYSTNGVRLSQPQSGVNLRVSKMADGSIKTDKVVIK